MSLKQLQKTINTTPDGIFGPATLRAAIEHFKLTDVRGVHFFAQVAHETGNFRTFEENLNYSYEALLKVFRYDFDMDRNGKLSEIEKRAAKILARHPEQIANFVYANQNGNGDWETGDGWKYRGRGALQTTGRANYQQFAEYIEDLDIMDNPDLVKDKYPFESALFFFEKHNLWSICDKGINDDAIKLLTRRINGGYNGLAHRRELTYKFAEWI